MAPSEIGIFPQHTTISEPTSRVLDIDNVVSGSGSIPKGWPASLESPMAWTSASFASDSSYIYVLNDADKQEIRAALKHFDDLGLCGHEVGVDNFPLPTLADKLRKAAEDIHEGKGFFILRGIDHEEYSGEDNIVIFLGVSSYIGEKRGRQDDYGRMLSHVRMARLMECQSDQRPIKDSNLGCAFHTDVFCDILAMQTRRTAAKGGGHIIASAWTIYNELAKTRPDLLNLLTKPDWPFDVRGRLCQKETRPVLYFYKDHIIMHVLPEALLGVSDIPRAAECPVITEAQFEALAALQMLATKHQLVIHTIPGDLMFVNNHSLLHSREAFDDDPNEIKKCRHLVRLWLKNEKLSWELPAPLQRGNQLIFYDDEIDEVWNVAPEPRLNYSLRERFSP